MLLQMKSIKQCSKYYFNHRRKVDWEIYQDLFLCEIKRKLIEKLTKSIFQTDSENLQKFIFLRVFKQFF